LVKHLTLILALAKGLQIPQSGLLLGNDRLY
jgi:hypothetical protein